MKRRHMLAAAGLAVCVLGALTAAVALPGRGPAPVTSAAVESDGGPAEPEDYFLAQRAGTDGKLDTKAYRAAVKQAQAIRAQGDAAQAPRQLRGAWELTGPTNVGGRIVDVSVDPANANVFYVTAATGGVWKGTRGTNAAGQNTITIEKTWPDDLPQSMGAIDIGSDGRIWAGTGEHNPGGGSITFGGSGIYVSEDGGASWKKRGLEDSSTTGEILVSPADPDTIFVAASGDLFNPGGERGIYRSTNGGASWRLVLPPETPFTGGIDLAIHPSNPNRIYAAMWDHRREPDLRTYGGVGSGLYRSNDGGDTWTRLDNVTALSPGDPVGLARSSNLGRIGVAIAPSNPSKLYVITTQTFGQDGGFYVSSNGGDSFQPTATRPGSQGGFGWWFGRIWVDPANESHLFVAGVNLRRSTDGGNTWSSSTGIHVDQHGMEFVPSVPGLVYLGNDGGTYVSTSNGVSNSWRQADYEPYTQEYTFNVASQNATKQTSGTQDNSCVRSWPTPGSDGAPDTWFTYGCGDGLSTPIDWADNDIYYGCSQYGSCTRFNDDPADTAYPRRNITTGTASARRNWLTPVVIDPNDARVIYYAGNQLNRSTDKGTTWTAISPPHPNDLTGTFAGPNRVDPIYPNWGTITTVGLSKTEPSQIYVGTDTGRLWKTEDLGQTWTEFVGKGLPTRWVTRVAVDPRDADVVYATFSGFRNGEDAAHVFRTTDGGATWENISGNLPNAPVNDVVIDTARETVFVGSDVGVFYLKNGKKNWHAAGSGFPLAPVMDLDLHETTSTLFAGSFGRSAWKLTVG